MGDWRLLGSFIGKDHHQAQDFKLLFPAWAKFLKIRLLSHYGNEHFCTVSTVKVFGTSMLEDMKREIIIDTPQMGNCVTELQNGRSIRQEKVAIDSRRRVIAD